LIGKTTEPQEKEEDESYDALYIGGYKDVKSSSALLSVSSNSVKVQITKQQRELMGPGLKGSYRKLTVSAKNLFEVPYASLEIVNITNEREITALRTFLIGPLFAALFKKENMLLNLGFRDEETGLLQTPYFKIAHGDIWKCYTTINKRLRRASGLQDTNAPARVKLEQ
jgi:hypothetical protein